MSLISGGSTLSVATAPKARAFKFSIRLIPDQIPGGLEEIGNWAPDPAPPSFNCTYACGNPVKRTDRVGDDGLLHTFYFFRGYAEFKGQVTMAQMTTWLGVRSACEPVQVKDREKYIKDALNDKDRIKGDDLISRGWEVGSESRVSKQGERNDVNDIRDILRDFGPIQGAKIVADKYPGYFMRYASGLERLADILQPVPKDAGFAPRVWQEALIQILKGPTHDRWIFWICDEKGGMGKSRVTTHLCCEMNAIELAGRSQDIAYAYNSQPIVIFDVARATKLELCTDLFESAEKLKDGRIFSSKYMSKTKAFKPPHVIFFSNVRAPPGVWSADRVQEIVLAGAPPFSPTSVPIDTDPEAEEDGVSMYNRLAKGIVERREKERKEKRDREDEEGV
jgi:hypothetical protein